MIPAYGMVAEAARYERIPDGPGQSFVAGATAADYARSELLERLRQQGPGTLGLEEGTLSTWTMIPPAPTAAVRRAA